MPYLDKKYSPVKLQQRSFILSSFTRMKMTLTVSIYEFADSVINEGWLPQLNKLEQVDQEILNKYWNFMDGYEPRRH